MISLCAMIMIVYPIITLIVISVRIFINLYNQDVSYQQKTAEKKKRAANL